VEIGVLSWLNRGGDADCRAPDPETRCLLDRRRDTRNEVAAKSAISAPRVHTSAASKTMMEVTMENRAAKGRIEAPVFESQVLKGNPLGDSHEREVVVYLPPGYDGDGRAYPVAYCLTGFTGFGRMLLNRRAFFRAMDERLDHLVATGRIDPLIVVMPDCLTAYGGSQYINSPATGRYEDYLVEEIVPFIDERYRTDPMRRAVFGKSSGGYGAMVLGMRHPDVFRILASHSGDAYFECCYKADFWKFVAGIARHGGVEKFLADFPAMEPLPEKAVELLNVIAMSACYSPNADAPPGFEFPFDLETGELRVDVWSRWLEHDPVFMIERYEGALRGLKGIFLDAGLKDEFNLHLGARIFCSRLRDLGIPYTHEEFDGGHFQIEYRYNRSLEFISERFRE
jgi:enterochelin esterase family protein